MGRINLNPAGCFASWVCYTIVIDVIILSSLMILSTSDLHSASGLTDPNLIIFHYEGQDTTSNVGEIITPLGDINSDGYDDIAVSSRSPVGTFLFLGGREKDAVPDGFWPDYYGAVPPIDLNGDGIRDLIIRKPGGGLYFFEGYRDSLASTPFDSLFSDTIGAYFRFFNRVAYIDDDGYADLVVLEDGSRQSIRFYSGCPIIDKLTDWSFVLSHIWLVSGLTLIDYNGDGHLDICAGINGQVDTSGYIDIFFGPDFDSLPNLVLAPPIEQFNIRLRSFPYKVANITDINNDGWNDLGVVYVADTGGYFPLVYFCGPNADTLPDRALNAEGRIVSAVGDINNDGFDDFACGGAGSWEGMLFLFLGGPGGDPNFDEIITSDDLPPVFLDDIGYNISNIGDFNGDGIDDFMFSCTNFLINYNPYDVFVVAGSESLIVDTHDNQLVPEHGRIGLNQNYPNPFNPATTIEFWLSSRNYAEISVYNSIGEVITTLVHSVLPAGAHHVEWNGTDRYGHPVASGLYFYQLNAGGVQEAKKLIVIR